MTKIASNLQIDSARLWDTIHETAKFGATPKGGVRRLTLGAEDKQVRDWFRSACESAGLEVHVDALGSMFGLRKGRDMSKAPVGLGSHLDTQPTGGKFDGVLGTLAALEVVRTLNDAGIETETPICIVNWTNEEGSRFAPATMASAAYAGDYTTENILARTDAAGVSVGEALDTIGYRGEEPVGARKFGAFVELHIEQGPLLEAENKIIGVVDRGQGITWYDGKITGFESHAGTTPMPLRRDALAALSEVVLAIERIAKAHGPNAVGTVGEAVIAAPSRNVIPGEVAFTADIRSPASETLEAIDQDLRAAMAQIASRRRVEISFEAIWRKPPTIFNPKLVEAVENATKSLGYTHRRITSGAGHDACNLANVVPSAMIFVPCKDGVSHNELEDATQADCTAGANTLMHTVLALAGVAS
ncbi:MAG TPA: Zn-dependent hydrolase [Bradyrhizobium sp.]|jgi:N-carbamoyl-L-amino-acid hydrolase|nr:Zn-dependent hydrolase [Bradyrhizobium sp.]